MHSLHVCLCQKLGYLASIFLFTLMSLETKKLSVDTDLFHFCLVSQDFDDLINSFSYVKYLDVLPEVLLFLLKHGVVKHIMNKEVNELSTAPYLL